MQPCLPATAARVIILQNRKLDRLVSEEVKTVHVGVCRLMDDKKECPRMTKICEMIDSRGIQVIRGTHRE